MWGQECCFKSCRTASKQAVAVKGRLSGLSLVISLVPQETVLGPILFLLHISSIAREVSPESTVSSYVDDTRVTRCMANPLPDCQALQQDLQAVYRLSLMVTSLRYFVSTKTPK